MPSERAVRLKNPRGLQLSAVLLVPEGRERPPVVAFAHGLGSSKASPRNRATARQLVEAGLAAFLLDFTGHGESEGAAAEATLERQVEDLRCAIDWLAASRELGPIGVAGSSSGGAVALAEAVADPRVVALVLRVPSSDARLAEAVRLSVPTLVIEGEHDPLLARNRELVGRMTCENRLVVVPGAGHLFEEPGTAELAAEATAAWFQRWLAGATANAGGERTPRRLRIVGVEATAGFSDRAQAGRALAERLQAYRGSDTLVLALPRGGIAVAEPIAQALEADLDVFVSSKLRAPSQPELAIGALAEGDVVLWNDDIVRSLRVSQSERTSELERVRAQLTERLALYRAAAPRLPIKDRTAIVTDDGVATGATLKAAIAAVAREGPRRLVVALPGGPRETLEEIARLPRVHEVVVLVVPEHFYAVGQLYRSFAQVSTDEVCAALRRARRSGG